ncbi:MAG: hypothetical protein B7X94_00105 [Hydrogenophilales bacterium 17-62-8]|nr:MAG: hypothetical protein B7X94_00105 [Hydrogenophilales bacterium 17-62-8]
MKRFTVKIVQGIARLARWRRLSASSTESLDAPDPDASPSAVRHSLHDQTERGVEQDAAPEPKPSLLVRLKTLFNRSSQSVQQEADAAVADIPQEKSSAVRASSNEDAVAAEEAPPSGLQQRARAMLTNKWVLISGGSVMLIALVATLAGLLLQSGKEKAQLQSQLLAAQQKLKQGGIAQKPVGVKPAPIRPAIHPTVASAASVPARSGPAAAGGECELSNPENAAENLRRCIDSFNAMSE